MAGGLPRESLYTEADMLSFAREAMDRGRRAGLEEAAKLSDDMSYDMGELSKAIRALAEDSK